MEYDEPHHRHARLPQRSKVKVIRSRRQFNPCLPITRQRNVAETPRLAGRLSVKRLTFRTSSKVKRSKVKITRPLNAVTGNQPYLRNGKAYKLQSWYTDGVRWLASPCAHNGSRRPASLTCAMTSNLKALGGCSVTTCGGGGILWRPHYRPHNLF